MYKNIPRYRLYPNVMECNCLLAVQLIDQCTIPSLIKSEILIYTAIIFDEQLCLSSCLTLTLIFEIWQKTEIPAGIHYWMDIHGSVVTAVIRYRHIQSLCLPLCLV